MRKLNKSGTALLCFIIIILFISSNLSAGDSNDNLTDILEKIGIENITIINEADKIILSYENRIFRNEIEAIEKIVELLAPFLTDYTHLILLPKNKNVPICMLTIDVNRFHDFALGNITREVFIESLVFTLDPDDLRKEIRKVERKNKTELKTDIVIYPMIKTRHGDYDKLFQIQAGIAPAIQTTLGRGVSLFAQLIVPIYDNLADDSDFVRPGILALNSTIRLPSNIFISTTLGQFANVDRYGIKWEHRYGFDWEIKKYFDNGIWSLGANFGFTGESTYKDRLWKLESLNTFVYLINAMYRIEKYNMSLAAKYGQFIYEDKSLRIDVNRQFGEVEIGFYTILSKGVKNGGFNISIPIFPSKYYSGSIRILPAENFEYEYRAKRLPREGQMYVTGYSIDNFRKGLSRDYIEAFLFDKRN